MEKTLTHEQRLILKDMISQNNVVETTELLRELKHSAILRTEINKLLELMKEYDINDEMFLLHVMSECYHLYTYYTDIYTLIKKDNIDMTLLNKLLDILEKIENGTADQHEASYEVGIILMNIYKAGAVKNGEKLDAMYANESKAEKGNMTKPLSWAEYKTTILPNELTDKIKNGNANGNANANANANANKNNKGKGKGTSTENIIDITW